jgi:hypothetical protein
MDSCVLLSMLLFFGGIGLLIFWSVRNVLKQQQTWAAFAQRHGLTNGAAHERHLTGLYEGQQLELKVVQRRSGKNRYSVMVLQLDVGGLVSRNFSLKPETLGDKLLNFFARADDEIGQADVDRHFELKNVNARTASVLKHPEVRHQLFKVAKTYQSFSIREGQLSVETYAVPTSLEALESLIRPALTLVRTMKSATSGAQKGTTR